MNTATIRQMIRERRTVVDLVPELCAEIDALRARLAEVEAERDLWERDAHNLAWSRERECEAKHAAEAALARVETTLCSAMCPCCEDVRAALRQAPSDSEGRPQDEEAAEEVKG